MKSAKRDGQAAWLTTVGMLAALIFVGNYLRVPFMGTKLTGVNALCVLAGLLIGPIGGFWAAGIGSLFYDILSGYGLESLITFVSKGAIGLVAGLIAYRAAHRAPFGSTQRLRVVLGAVLGSFTYVALYMLKTFVLGLTMRGLTMDATLLSMASKFPGSTINALFASVAGPLLFFALRPALSRAGLWRD